MKIVSSNVAIPPSLTSENEDGQLVVVFYVQLENGYLSKSQLEMAVEVNVGVQWYLDGCTSVKACDTSLILCFLQICSKEENSIELLASFQVI